MAKSPPPRQMKGRLLSAKASQLSHDGGVAAGVAAHFAATRSEFQWPLGPLEFALDFFAKSAAEAQEKEITNSQYGEGGHDRPQQKFAIRGCRWTTFGRTIKNVAIRFNDTGHRI